MHLKCNYIEIKIKRESNKTQITITRKETTFTIITERTRMLERNVKNCIYFKFRTMETSRLKNSDTVIQKRMWACIVAIFAIIKLFPMDQLLQAKLNLRSVATQLQNNKYLIKPVYTDRR